VLYFHDASSLEHDPSVLAPEHPDTPERIDAIETAMTLAGWPGCERRPAPAASVEELMLVHAPEHVERIRELCMRGVGQIDSDTFVGEPSYRAALHAAGGACAMVRALLAHEAQAGFCAVRPSGHHATPEEAMGFCLFNNVAIAAELAIRELGVSRALIIDWDVHHGNGTAEIFRRRRDVLFASIHQSGLFPGTGALSDGGSGDGLGYTINVPVPIGSDEEVWLSVLEHVIVPVAEEFAPELVLISAGFALTVIGVVAVTLMGVWLALGGVLLPATAILAVTLTAAIWPALQGILLTVEVIGFFIAAMLLLARIRATAITPLAGGQEIASAPEEHA